MYRVVFGQVSGPESLGKGEQLKRGEERSTSVVFALGEGTDVVDRHRPGFPRDAHSLVFAVLALFDELFGLSQGIVALVVELGPRWLDGKIYIYISVYIFNRSGHFAGPSYEAALCAV